MNERTNITSTTLALAPTRPEDEGEADEINEELGIVPERKPKQTFSAEKIGEAKRAKEETKQDAAARSDAVEQSSSAVEASKVLLVQSSSCVANVVRSCAGDTVHPPTGAHSGG